MNSPVWHPFTQHGLNEPIPLVTHAEGAGLFTADGRRIIDAISSWWVTTHGHCHPRIVAAITAQATKLDQVIFAGWTHEPAERLTRELLELMPRPLSHVFFSDSGSTSVEVALKMALGFWRNRGDPRHRIIVMEGSYHGDTIGGMSVGARGVFNQAYEPLLFDSMPLPFPGADNAQATIDELERLCEAEDKPAALLIEPLVLGAGGMKIYSPKILAELHAVCARHGVLFIADEVMTGWGRTGTLLACDQAGIAPDLLCLSKGITGGSLPLAVTVASEAIFAAHCSQDLQKQLFHSSSYTANPIACAAALANLEIWREEPVLERIADLGQRQAQQLAGLSRIHNARQIGTITAMELKESGASYLATLGLELRAFFVSRNVLLRPLGNTIYVLPPYCISDEDLGAVYRAIGEAIDSL